MIDFEIKYNKIKLMNITPKNEKIGRRNCVSTSNVDGSRSRENYSKGNVKREYRNTDDRSRERNGEYRGKSNQTRQSHSYNSRPRNNYMAADKDKDEEQPKRRSEPRRTMDKDARYKEQQPDKFDIINRLEKEKKAMQRKEEEKKKSMKHSKTVAKPKRVNNIDWTREYENGSYDDDDMDMYLSQ